MINVLSIMLVTWLVRTEGLSSLAGSSPATTIASGIAAVIAAYSAYKISQRDANADDLRAAKANLGRSSRRTKALEADLLTMTQWAFRQRRTAAAAGVTLEEIPPLLSDQNEIGGEG